jgi:hypothetical protein
MRPLQAQTTATIQRSALKQGIKIETNLLMQAPLRCFARTAAPTATAGAALRHTFCCLRASSACCLRGSSWQLQSGPATKAKPQHQPKRKPARLPRRLRSSEPARFQSRLHRLTSCGRTSYRWVEMTLGFSADAPGRRDQCLVSPFGGSLRHLSMGRRGFRTTSAYPQRAGGIAAARKSAAVCQGETFERPTINVSTRRQRTRLRPFRSHIVGPDYVDVACRLRRGARCR